MPNRILKESICYSENIDQLTQFQEIFFYRLIVNCDDYGRMDARPKVLASKLFPLRDVRMNQIADALRALTSAELVTIYEEDGHPFLQMKTWDRHQTIRAKRSKYPAPESNCIQLNADEIICKQMNSNEIICKQMNADESKCSRNPIQSVSNSVSYSVSETRAREENSKKDDLFEIFWNAYPRKESKPAAKKAFDKLKVDSGLLDEMLKAIDVWKVSDQWTENGGQFIPYPATWLNNERWKDQVPPKRVKEKTVIAQQYNQRPYEQESQKIVDDFVREVEEWKLRTGGA